MNNEQIIGRTTSPFGERLVFYRKGDDVEVERGTGHRHYYCPASEWDMALSRMGDQFERVESSESGGGVVG